MEGVCSFPTTLCHFLHIRVAERVGAFPHGVRGVILPLRVAMAGEEKKWAVIIRNKLVMRM